MGKYDDLTPAQENFLQRLVEHSQQANDSTYALTGFVGSKGMLRDGRTGQLFEDVPKDDVFYAGLGHLEYLDTHQIGAGTMHINLTRKAYDYCTYAKHSPFVRWWIDLSSDLGGDSTLRSKLFWALGTIIVATAVNVLLRFLGLT